MAISIQDLDQLLNYDATTHSVAGMPSLAPGAGAAAAPAPGSAMPVVRPGVISNKIPLAVRQAAAPGNIAAINSTNPSRPMMPTAGAGAPATAPVAPTIPDMNAPAEIGNGIPTIAAPAALHGKAAYEEGLPKITAAPGTEAYGQQKQELLDYQKAHPWGSPDSEHPSFWGKLGHGLAKAGETALDVLAPAVSASIPGTPFNDRMQERENQRLITEGAANDARKAAGSLIPWVDSKTGAITMLPAKEWGMEEAAAERAGATTGAAETKAQAEKDIAAGKDQTAKDIAAGKNKSDLLKIGFDENGAPLPDDKLSTQQRATRDMTQAHTKLQEAQAAVEAAKNDPNSPVAKAAASNLALRQAEFQNKLEEQGLVKPSGQTVSRGNAADAALQLLPGLEDAVKANGAAMGPVMGRIAKGEIKIGDVDPAVQKLYSQLESFYALQPSVHGFRNAEFVKDFDTFIGNLQTNPDAVIAGLEGLKPTLEAVKKSGLTYQRRIVEPAPGAAAPAAGAPAAGGGTIPSFKQFTGG